MEEHMDVIGHHHEGFQEITISVEVPKRVGDQSGDVGILKDAITASRVQPRVDGF